MAESVAQATASTQLRREEKPIRGKVAAVLDEERLVLNVGADHGVAQNMVFNIIETRVIRDPDTGDELGKVDVTKFQVQVGNAEERMSIAYPYQEYVATDFLLRPIRQKFKIKNTQPSTRALPALGSSTQYIEVAVGDIAISD